MKPDACGSLYVHVPFCLSKCAYCALCSKAIAKEAVPRGFAEAAAREFALRAGDNLQMPLSTIYFGGGTPAMLGADGLERLALALSAVGAKAGEETEWTVEFNPSPRLADAELLGRVRAIGANRASFGVQSFDDGVLAAAGRIHTAAEARAAVSAARAAGFANIGIDLIAGLPGDDREKWRASLEVAVSLGVQHISVYSLIVEPGTPLARAAETGAFAPCGDSELLDRLCVAEKVLEAEGFRRYEISNYALPGFECRHNLGCWRGEDYLGIGPGASSRIGLTRRTNAPDVAAWLTALASETLPPADALETLLEADDAEERFVFGLRMAEGVSPRQFAERHHAAQPLVSRWEGALARLAAIGIAAEIAPWRWALTERGREVADSAIERLLA
jgi:oxygen-independent coproporphyrinogen-3 oxidase